MRGLRQLSRGLDRVCVDSVATQGQSTACQSAAAVRAYSSAISSSTQPQAMRDSFGPYGFDFSHGPTWSCQPTSLVTWQYRNFSGDASEELPGGDGAQAAAQVAGFDPSTVLDAVSGMEEDSWIAAREDVWFFNRYMQTVLKTAQELTGLPW